MSKHKHEWTESVANSGPASILSYCASSILMTVTNKFVVNLDNFNMNFVMLFVQSLVCTVTLCILRIVGVANFRSLNRTDVKNWFPISLLLVKELTIPCRAHLHNFQESDDHSHCLWRGPLLWRKSHFYRVDVIYYDGPFICSGHLGRSAGHCNQSIIFGGSRSGTC